MPARLWASLNQLTHHADAGKSVVVADALLRQPSKEVGRLRLALPGVDTRP